MDASEYYKIRLEHTLQHTQQSTKLIYLINGGILALVYFIVKLPAWPYQQTVLAFAIEGLAVVNIVHAAFIIRQGKWYSNIDAAFANSLAPRPTIEKPIGLPWVRTHTLYAIIHIFLAVALAVGGGCIFFVPDSLPTLASYEM